MGAGASSEVGAPLMKDFLKRAQEIAPSDELTTVMNGVNRFSRTHSKFPIYDNNLEDVFAAFEMAEVLGHFPGVEPEEIKKLVPAMRRVIEQTLDKAIFYSLGEHTAGRWEPRALGVYADFVRLVLDIRDTVPHRHDVAVITFNYDVALDWAFSDCGQSVDYALGKRNTDAIPLLKLHGSLNWAKYESEKGEEVLPWDINNYLENRRWPPMEHGTTRPVNVRMSEEIKKYRPEGKDNVAPVVAPFVIPPTWNKSGRYGEISSVWAAAARALADAENIFILGYSMPETDKFFKYLMALGTAADIPLERLWVFNPNSGLHGEIEKSGLLGPGAKRKYEFISEMFKEAIKTIRRRLLDRR